MLDRRFAFLFGEGNDESWHKVGFSQSSERSVDALG